MVTWAGADRTPACATPWAWQEFCPKQKQNSPGELTGSFPGDYRAACTNEGATVISTRTNQHHQQIGAFPKLPFQGWDTEIFLAVW